MHKISGHLPDLQETMAAEGSPAQRLLELRI